MDSKLQVQLKQNISEKQGWLVRNHSLIKYQWKSLFCAIDFHIYNFKKLMVLAVFVNEVLIISHTHFIVVSLYSPQYHYLIMYLKETNSYTCQGQMLHSHWKLPATKSILNLLLFLVQSGHIIASSHISSLLHGCKYF